jgi:hypothetical protein
MTAESYRRSSFSLAFARFALTFARTRAVNGPGETPGPFCYMPPTSWPG